MNAALAPNDRNYLRPDQVKLAREEIASLEARLQNPHIQDKGEVRRQLIRVRKQTEEQAPRPPENTGEEEALVKREKELLAEIIPAMCSMEEMRKSPPGAVDKYIKGEGSTSIKTKIIEWKNIRLRLNPGEREIANLERFRPVASTLNMDNAMIPGKQFYMPETNGPSIIFTDEEMMNLRALKPSLADAVGVMSNEQRALVKDLLEGFNVASKPKRTMSDAHKAAMKAGREAKAAKKAAKKAA